MRRQQLGHIRIQGVIGEKVLRADGQQCDLDVEQGAVQAGDTVNPVGCVDTAR